jgi:hypothetical protein
MRPSESPGVPGSTQAQAGTGRDHDDGPGRPGGVSTRILIPKNTLAVTTSLKRLLTDVRTFRPSQIIPGFFNLEKHLNSLVNDYFKRMETLENGYLVSSRLV